MDSSLVMTGLTNVLSLTNIACILGGTVLGLFVGAMPGLSATMALALLLPLTFSFDPATGLSMLAALYVGASYGGSIAAILLRTPGTPSAAATVLDGFPLSQQGKAGQALGISLFASFFGGLMSGIALLTAAPLLGTLVLEFGPVELFAIAVLGITIIGSLAQGSVISGLFSGGLGLLVSTVGMDLTTGTPRMTFDQINLFSGIDFTVALIGLFSVPQALTLIENSNQGEKVASRITDRLIPRLQTIKKLMPNILRSSGIGVIVGLIPGTGGDTASWFAYNEAKRFAKDKSHFGKGEIAGVAAPEAANNAVVGGALIPTIALGIPGSSSTAILLGALMVQGILPGPNLLTDYGDVTYTLIWAVILANVGLLVVGLAFTKMSVSVTRVPDGFVACAILTLCIIGAFAINNSLFDVGLMLGFGLFGYWLAKAGVSPAPMVIGLILGPVMEVSFQQSMLIGNDSFGVFLDSPIATVLLILALLSILQATPAFRWVRRPLKRRLQRG
ncbi:tripartite tricarboxylate transporter permease [Salinicola rhizosphaerae]|uniref:C4-dicarboxylate ABC transporter permease n=1 Tax=Salinicola rhizosphaerae TaxID=1443141 RepID=A0ABQ3DYB1_9GAMM|nr:tripartite tricarboxylate transporter permease [Salinicola rhizosphaerae]GHB17670.1 C4-dicarboxylate ABC transporter permease [Salinicola rhizosphaerae]